MPPSGACVPPYACVPPPTCALGLFYGPWGSYMSLGGLFLPLVAQLCPLELNYALGALLCLLGLKCVPLPSVYPPLRRVHPPSGVRAPLFIRLCLPFIRVCPYFIRARPTL
jgi:hypothetical protein